MVLVCYNLDICDGFKYLRWSWHVQSHSHLLGRISLLRVVNVSSQHQESTVSVRLLVAAVMRTGSLEYPSIPLCTMILHLITLWWPSICALWYSSGIAFPFPSPFSNKPELKTVKASATVLASPTIHPYQGFKILELLWICKVMNGIVPTGHRVPGNTWSVTS